jgi:hypothetical protein
MGYSKGNTYLLDVLVKFLIVDMLPAIFEERRMEYAEKERLKCWSYSLPGGERLWREREAGRVALSHRSCQIADESRDTAAPDIRSQITQQPKPYLQWLLVFMLFVDRA